MIDCSKYINSSLLHIIISDIPSKDVSRKLFSNQLIKLNGPESIKDHASRTARYMYISYVCMRSLCELSLRHDDVLIAKHKSNSLTQTHCKPNTHTHTHNHKHRHKHTIRQPNHTKPVEELGFTCVIGVWLPPRRSMTTTRCCRLMMRCVENTRVFHTRIFSLEVVMKSFLVAGFHLITVHTSRATKDITTS